MKTVYVVVFLVARVPCVFHTEHSGISIDARRSIWQTFSYSRQRVYFFLLNAKFLFSIGRDACMSVSVVDFKFSTIVLLEAVFVGPTSQWNSWLNSLFQANYVVTSAEAPLKWEATNPC